MPTENPLPTQFALQSALAGLSAREGLRQYREAGGKVNDATWFRLRGQVESFLASREGIYNEPQHLRPTAQEILPWDTTKAKGYVQQVEILAREKATGTVISIPYTSIGKTLRSRQAIVAEALAVYSDDNAEKYGQTILGGIYTGTYQAGPRE